uniref:Major facilitator superfamily (MFS) profile domain-containing protein n=1 Tax=Oryza meridionalis TaxID=40149 RepID=A0A0E0DS23_9ORYZ
MAGGSEFDIQEAAASASATAAAAAAPLLEKKITYWEGCPGCAVERRKAENPGVPYLQFFHIWIIILVSCLPITFIYPFLYFMIRDLHVAKTIEDIGFYGGFVGASYMLGRALTSTIWGMVADRIGRKPAYTTEVCRPEHQAIGLSLDSTSWAMGLIIGSVIGGYLAQETLHDLKVHKKDDGPIESPVAHFAKSEELLEQHSTPTINKNLFKNWPLMSSIILYCIICFDDMAYTEIFSLWSESDKKYGGLSFSPEDVGQVLAISGVSVMLYQTFIYPNIEKILGPINTSRVAAVLSMVLLFTYSPMTHLPRPWVQIVLNIVSVLKNVVPQWNHKTQDQRGTANGLATTLMSFFKAFAPAGAGIVFSWAQKRQHAFFFPGDQMVFYLLFIVEFVGLVIKAAFVHLLLQFGELPIVDNKGWTQTLGHPSSGLGPGSEDPYKLI